jgi:opacity protein-like surface antigen
MTKQILIILFPILLVAPSIYSQLNREAALSKGGWSSGIAGWVGWENYKTTNNLGDNSEVSKNNGFNFTLSVHNGNVVETNGIFGFEFQWQEKSNTEKPDPNPENSSEYVRDRKWFLGLWARYYMPLGGNFAMFLEGSGGYSVFNQKSINDGPGESLPVKAESFANGFAYNAGVGVSNFISPNVAFEITGRYEGGSLNGDKKNNDGSQNALNVKRGNIFILFGFQIFLR